MWCSVSATPLAPFPFFRSPLLFLFSYQEKETRKQINKDDFPQAHVELIWSTGVDGREARASVSDHLAASVLTAIAEC